MDPTENEKLEADTQAEGQADLIIYVRSYGKK
jgi:hypothetical protein